jgi:hypothetical protein
MIKRILTTLMILLSQIVLAQQNQFIFFNESEVDELPKIIVNNEGLSFESYFERNFKWNKGMVEGEQIVVKFIVDTSGFIRNVDILRLPKKCDVCIIEYIKILTSISFITSATKDGVKVPIEVTHFFKFKISR